MSCGGHLRPGACVGRARGRGLRGRLDRCAVAALPPGLTGSQGAADRSTLIAVVIGVAVGAIVLVPSLILLFGLFSAVGWTASRPPGAALHDSVGLHDVRRPLAGARAGTRAGGDPRPNGLVAIPFLVISVLGAEMFFDAGDWPVGTLFVGLTARGVPEVGRLSCCTFVFVDEATEDVTTVELQRCS